MRHQRVIQNFEARPDPLPVRQPQGSSLNDLVFLSVLLLWLLAAATVAHADDQIRAVRLSNVVGSVQIMNGTEAEFSQAYPNMPLLQGSTLKTGEDGRAEIQLEDGSMVRLTPNSSATMTVLGRTSDGDTDSEVDLLTGLSYVEMKGTANQRFLVRFGGSEVISPAPVEFRVNLDANPSQFAVLDGSAHLNGPGAAYSVEVRSGETVTFDATDISRYFLAQGVDGDSWDQWNTDRNQAMSQMAAQQTREAVGSGNSGAGWSDLDYYGDWYSSGSDGSFWVPNGAGAGWDPYGSGYWGYYGGLGGYAWISGYPWGWLPYHCGSWNYYNSVGWGWNPGGGCGSSWYPVGGFGHVPPNYHRIPRPLPITHPVSGFHPNPSGPSRNPIRAPFGRPLIAVDRGTEATTLTPREGYAPRTIAVNGGQAHLIPKTPVSGFSSGGGRPMTPTTAHVQTGFDDGRHTGSVPVYRPVAPSYGSRPVSPANGSSGFAPAPAYHPSSPSVANQPGASPRYSAPPAPHYSAPPPPSAPSGHASSGGSAPSNSGGRPR